MPRRESHVQPVVKAENTITGTLPCVTIARQTSMQEMAVRAMGPSVRISARLGSQNGWHWTVAYDVSEHACRFGGVIDNGT
jgi:hypothetical protein